MLVVGNSGPVPAGPVLPSTGSRGFNLLQLTEGGRPSCFMRCRDVRDEAARREALVLRALAADEALCRHVPMSGTASDAEIRVVASRYLSGPLLAQLVPRMTVDTWRGAVTEILALADRAGDVILASEPDLVSSAPHSLMANSLDALNVLAGAGFPARSADAIEALLRSGAGIPTHPQHGDLWPGNVIRGQDGWCLLDFEHFGLIANPLYDCCHLVQTSLDYLLAGGHGLEAPVAVLVRQESALATAIRSVLRLGVEAHRLGPDHGLAALAHYVTDMTARLISGGAGESVWRPLWRELASVADSAAEGIDLASCYFGSRASRHG